jgi:hypothetical protein
MKLMEQTMKHDVTKDEPDQRKTLERPRRPYVTPRLTDYGSLRQLTQSLASGTFSDATHMAASMCSGQCQ